MPVAWFFIALLLAAPLELTPGTTPRVSFVAHGPMGMKIEGASESLVVSNDGDSLLFSLPLSTLQTGIELRDKHMREALQTGSFPTAMLRVKRAAIPNTGADATVDVEGTLTLHGQTQAVPIHCTLHRGESLEVSAELQLEMTRYGIAPPSYLGVAVKPAVEISVSIRLSELKDGGVK